MIKFLTKYYKKASNGKMELFGKDGLDHGVIDASVMLGVGGLSYIFTRNTYITKYTLVVTWFIMRAVWYGIEVNQELAMQRKDVWRYTNKGTAWNPHNWTIDRVVDNTWPLKLGTPIMVAGLLFL